MKRILIHGEWVDMYEEDEPITQRLIQSYKRGHWHGRGGRPPNNGNVYQILDWWETTAHIREPNKNHSPLLLWPAKPEEPKENEYGEVTP